MRSSYLRSLFTYSLTGLEVPRSTDAEVSFYHLEDNILMFMFTFYPFQPLESLLKGKNA